MSPIHESGAQRPDHDEAGSAPANAGRSEPITLRGRVLDGPGARAASVAPPEPGGAPRSAAAQAVEAPCTPEPPRATDAGAAHAARGATVAAQLPPNFADALRDLDERERTAAGLTPFADGPATGVGDAMVAARPDARRWSRRWWWGGLGLAAVLLVAERAVAIAQAFAETPVTAALQGGVLAVLVVLALATGVKALRTRRHWARFDRLRADLRAALERDAPADAEWFEAFLQLTRLERRQPDAYRRLREAFHAGLSTRELCDLIDREVYAPIDEAMRRRVRAEATSTGVFIAASPWVVADVLLVIWRNLRLLDIVADAYGWPPGARSRWVLARGVLRNIALAGVSEFAIHSLSTTLLSEAMGKLTARVAQGVAVGLYTARLGTFARLACRVTPTADRDALRDDSTSIATEIRRSLQSAQPPR